MPWRVGARYEAGAGGRTVRATGIRSGEFHALGRELVEMRRLEELRPVKPQSCQPRSSARMKMMLGGDGSFFCAEAVRSEAAAKKMASHRGHGKWSDR